MKKITLLFLALILSGTSLFRAESPELWKGDKIVVRPYMQTVEGECYRVPAEGGYIARKGDLIEISYGYAYWDCAITETACVSTDPKIVKDYKNWQEVSIGSGILGSPATVSYFFKVVDKGECNITLTIDGKSYTYHFNCG
jgi:hypothetical protein